MRSGRFDHEITIERLTEGRSGALRERVNTWTPLRTVACEAEARPGREFFDNNTRHSESVVFFTCHYDDVSDVTESDRLLFNAEAYNIKTIIPNLTRRNETVISASRV